MSLARLSMGQCLLGEQYLSPSAGSPFAMRCAWGGFPLAKAETAAGLSKAHFHSCLLVISCYPSSCPSALGLFRF